MRGIFGLFLYIFCFLASSPLYAASGDESQMMYLAKQHIEKQDWNTAERYLLKVIKLNFKNTEARFLSAKAAEEQGELRLAKRRYKMAFKIDKKHLQSAIAWARVAEKLNSDDIGAAYTKVIKLDPKNALWHFKLAQRYIKKKSAKTERYLKKALKIDPDYRDALELMVKYHKKYGFAYNAKKYQKRLDQLASVIEKRIISAKKVTFETSPQEELKAKTEVRKPKTSSLAGQDDNDKAQVIKSAQSSSQPGHAQIHFAEEQPAKHGNARAQYKLGLIYDEGKRIKQDFKVAIQWYKKSAVQGYVKSQYRLASMYQNGQGSSRDFREAAAWYKRAAEQGHESAQYHLGSMYERGDGVLKNELEAVNWYEKSAAQWHVKSQRRLGEIYQQGKAVKQDYKVAVAWYRKAANQGDIVAQKNLGFMYENGYGVNQDYKEATKWYRQAANQVEN